MKPAIDPRIPISRLGFGVSGPHGTRLVPVRETIELIDAAARLGVTVFDTAPAYGAGEAERRLGLAMRGLPRDRFVISTKAGVTSQGLRRRTRDFAPGAIEASLRISLMRLGLDGVDVLWLHGAAPQELTASLFSKLDGLRRAGAFMLLGAAGRGPELDAALKTGRFDLMMTPVHPWLGLTGERRLRRAAEKGVGVFAIETAGPGPAPFRLPRKPADLYGLAKRAASPGRGPRLPAAEGLERALARPGVVCALTTTTRLAHLEANAAAAGIGPDPAAF